jgi:hypothetical protein
MHAHNKLVVLCKKKYNVVGSYMWYPYVRSQCAQGGHLRERP